MSCNSGGLLTQLPNYFLFMLHHGHGKTQRQLMHQAQSAQACEMGTGAEPYLLPSPYLINAGDTLTCEIAYNNTSNVTIIAASPGPVRRPIIMGLPIGTTFDIYITLLGGEPA
jgi:hypothetical protein